MRRLAKCARAALLAGVIAAAIAGDASAQDLLPGVFVGTPDGPQEVGVFAERTSGGRLRLSRGSLDDVQMVPGPLRLICNLPNWRLRSIWLSTKRLFVDDAAERRTLVIELRRLSVSATFAEVRASGDPPRWRKLLDDVGASEENPAYVFVTFESDGLVRDFVVGVDRDQ